MNSWLTNWHLYLSIGTLRVPQVSMHTDTYIQSCCLHIHSVFHTHYTTGVIVVWVCFCIGSPVSAQPVIMAAPSHPAVLPSGLGKTLALVPGGGGQVQPIHILQNPSQSSVTMVRVVTSAPPSSNPPNGYSTTSVGGAESNSELRGM